MSYPRSLAEDIGMALAIAPTAGTTSTNITSAYHSLKGCAKVVAVFQIKQADSTTGDCALLQATNVSGGSAKAVTARIWSNLDTAASDALVARTAATSYTTDAGVKNKLVIMEVDTSELDVAGGFDCIAADSDNLATGSRVACTLFFLGQRYKGTSPPTVLTN